MKKTRCALLFSALIALAGCSSCPDLTPPTVYVGVQANTEEEKTLAKSFLYEAYKESKDGNTFIVDLLKGDTTVRLLSKSSIDREAILKAIEKVEDTQSTDLAITSFFQRVKDLSEYENSDEELHAYLISSGTSNEATLTSISKTLEDLGNSDHQDNVYLYVLGLSEDNRLNISDSLNPLRERAEAVGVDPSEWQSLSTQYNSYYCPSES